VLGAGGGRGQGFDRDCVGNCDCRGLCLVLGDCAGVVCTILFFFHFLFFIFLISKPSITMTPWEHHGPASLQPMSFFLLSPSTSPHHENNTVSSRLV
jgi:hypothetical protein